MQDENSKRQVKSYQRKKKRSNKKTNSRDNIIGIISCGGYIPLRRLNRKSIVRHIGWLSPSIATVAQGERSFCNWDEDSLTMAVEACRDCLIGADKEKIDGLYLASTTLPFSDRLNASILSTALNMRENIYTADFTSGLKAGTSAIIAAIESIKSGEKNQMLVAAADRRETKAASLFEMLYGDGAASLLLGNENVIAEFMGAYSVSCDFVDHYRGTGHRFDYNWEERWIRKEGFSKIIPEAILRLMTKVGISVDEVDKIVYPCFFKREHEKIAKIIGISPEKVMDNMHDVCGDTGTAHPLIMFVRALEESNPGDNIIVASFGQGCDVLYFKATENILNSTAPSGINRSLTRGQATDSYMKFLKFRDLIITETGIRAEAPTQTALTTLWRKRKMILGFVGGRCKKCGTKQFPKTDICVNPDCEALHTQVDYEYADVPAEVMSFTGDLLAVSPDPPAIYGMVQYKGGGRLMVDFTDCELSKLKVGQSVRMVFRKHHEDQERGFTGYFWKALPQTIESHIRFDGRVAVVTGAGRGLGRTYAIDLAKRGAKIVVNDVGCAMDGSRGTSANPADAVVKEITDAGGTAVANYDSVSTAEGGRNIIRTALDSFGGVDILINNAGFLRDKTFAKMEPEMWYDVLNVHLNAAYYVTRPAFQAMQEKNYGRIVFTSSGGGLYGNFGQSNYGAAKMGLVGLMNSLKIEGIKHNIKVNTVAPFAMTRLSSEVFPSDLNDQFKPEHVASLVLYLCSELCDESGLILNAAGGFISRAGFVSGPGYLMAEGDSIPALEEIHKNWEKVNRLGNMEFDIEASSLMSIDMSFTEEQIPDEEEKRKALDIKKIITQLPSKFRPNASDIQDVIFQLRVSGRQGGDWHIIIRNEKCLVAEGVHNNPDVIMKIKGSDFVKLVRGEITASLASAAAKLRIEGDAFKAQLFEKLFVLKKPPKRA